jgi:Protein of unknown function (DUF3732)
MQIKAIVLYSRSGKRRTIEFQSGRLNVVTGDPGSGKSALLDIVEFCLGRDTLVMPVGPITKTVSWYGLLLEHDATRIFIGRPAPDDGVASTQKAMLEMGALIDPPDYERLEVNADTTAIRDQVGRLIGIDENAGEPRTPWAQSGLEANLGHATWLCLQGQGEIDNRDLLFHRQGETGIAQALRDTLPYFLGAVPREQAIQRQQLTAGRRDLRRAQADLDRAKAVDEEIDVSLLAMTREAVASGLLDEGERNGRAEMLRSLGEVLQATVAPVSEFDDVTAGRREALERERSDLRLALRAAGEQAELLRAMGSDETAFAGVVDQQISRLSSIDLLEEGDDNGTCPVCQQELSADDPSVAQMHQVVSELTTQLEGVESIRPRRREALEELTTSIDQLRERLRSLDDALVGLAERDEKAGLEHSNAESQAFTRGRIQHFLDTTKAATPEELSRLADVVEIRQRAVDALEQRLDPDATREELTARLAVVASDITTFSQRLELEHPEAVWLDINRLTVMTDTDQGAAPLFRVGSAENWVGYHLAAHLALHRYFTRHDRPVPRFLMLDQPSQAYYPSEVEQQGGVPEGEDDRAAVRRMYELMRDSAEELNPDFQIIVCDHANLPEDWFQDAVQHNWRQGIKLIPQEWIDDAA